MNSSFTRVALLTVFAAIAAAGSTTASAESLESSAANGTVIKLAQGATPEGWRKEGEPRYKSKKQKVQTDSRGWEVTKFPPEQEPRFKKSKSN